VLWQSADDQRPTPHSDTQRSAGLIDFANDRGFSKEEPDPAPTTTIAGLPPDLNVLGEQRWIGSVIYRTPAVFSASGGPDNHLWESFDTAHMTMATTCGDTSSFQVSSLVVGSALPTDPGRILDDLAAAGATMTKIGTVDVRGVATTRWKVGFDGSACHAPASTGAGLEVFTDGEQRLRRIVATYPQTKVKLPPVVVTTDLFDFGVPVHVTPPPADEVTDVTEFTAAMFGGAGKLDGTWREVAHSSGGAAFSLWFGRTTTGWRCFDLVPNPSSFETLGTPSPQHGPPLHDGHRPQCLYPGSPPGLATQGFVTRTTGDREQIVVAFAPGNANARLVHADGSTTAVPIDATTGVVDWTGPSRPEVTKVEADSLRGTASCATAMNVPFNGGPASGGVVGSGGISLPGAISLPGMCADPS